MIEEELEEIEQSIDDLFPSCKNCNRWAYYRNNKGICYSNKFEKDSYTTIMTKADFFCADFTPKRKIKI